MGRPVLLEKIWCCSPSSLQTHINGGHNNIYVMNKNYIWDVCSCSRALPTNVHISHAIRCPGCLGIPRQLQMGNCLSRKQRGLTCGWLPREKDPQCKTRSESVLARRARLDILAFFTFSFQEAVNSSLSQFLNCFSLDHGFAILLPGREMRNWNQKMIPLSFLLRFLW